MTTPPTAVRAGVVRASTRTTRIAVGLAALLLAAGGSAACGSSDPDQVDTGRGEATVRVEVAADEAPLERVCIGDVCTSFDPADEVRQAGIAAVVDAGTLIEIVQAGQAAQGGLTAPAPIGGCTTVRITAGDTAFGGCED